jgi:hypothetical protein
VCRRVPTFILGYADDFMYPSVLCVCPHRRRRRRRRLVLASPSRAASGVCVYVQMDRLMRVAGSGDYEHSVIVQAVPCTGDLWSTQCQQLPNGASVPRKFAYLKRSRPQSASVSALRSCPLCCAAVEHQSLSHGVVVRGRCALSAWMPDCGALPGVSGATVSLAHRRRCRRWRASTRDAYAMNPPRPTPCCDVQSCRASTALR